MNTSRKKIKIILAVTFIIFAGFFLWNENKTSQFDINTQTQQLNETHTKFTHPDIGFSLEYQKELIIERFLENDGSETIVFSNGAEIQEDKLGFQIFITEFGKDEVLTQERILEDLPNAVIEEPIEIVLGDGTIALLFWSEAPEIGKTREVWFTHSGYLYEITTFEHLDKWLAFIMKTWSFNEI